MMNNTSSHHNSSSPTTTQSMEGIKAADHVDHNPGNSRRRNIGPRRSSIANWTEEEDDILADAVEKNEGKSWKKVAQCLPGRTDVQCLHRWQKVLNPNWIKGPWKKEEDILLIELVEKFGDEGKRWSKIAKELPGRMGKQCRERWYNHLKPEINKAPWTSEEENILIDAHAKYGNKWSMIAKFLPGRTENSVKNYWNCTMKRRRCGNYASVKVSSVDSGSNEKAKCSDDERACCSCCNGSYHEPIDVNDTMNRCGPSISHIKESTADLLKRIKTMLRNASTSFVKPSIFTRKGPKHNLDKDFPSNTLHNQDDQY